MMKKRRIDMGFFKEKYDAIIIGGALSGMSCALELAA
jgi:glycerol-3-phosphate dehydrogenase